MKRCKICKNLFNPSEEQWGYVEWSEGDSMFKLPKDFHFHEVMSETELMNYTLNNYEPERSPED